MFDYVPEMYRDEFADTEEEALAWVQEVISDKQAARIEGLPGIPDT